MLIDFILFFIAFMALAAGSYADLKTREVPDWLSFGLIFSGIGIRFIYSAVSFDWSYLVYGLFGLAVFVVLGYIMFYAGQWGGGDSKLLMGLGAVFGMPLTLNPIPFILIFIVNVLFAGALYGLGYSISLAISHRKQFLKHVQKMLYEEKIIKIRKATIIFSVIALAIVFFLVKDPFILWPLVAVILMAYLSFYVILFVKAVEKSAMFKLVEPEKLTEGDWIAKDYFVDGKKICGPKDLGISKKQMKELIALKRKGKIKKIKIKEGIPFVPSFFIAFIISIIFGAWFIFLLGI